MNSGSLDLNTPQVLTSDDEVISNKAVSSRILDARPVMFRQRECRRRVSLDAPSVSFAPNHLVHHLHCTPTATNMTCEEKITSWYSDRELHVFKEDVRAASRRLRCQLHGAAGQTSHQSTGGFPTNKTNFDGEVECTRGLEQRASYERQRRKYLAIQTILEYQRRLQQIASSGKDHATHVVDSCFHLALVSGRATEWFSHIAATTAQEDFASAYPERAHPIDRPTYSFCSIKPALLKRGHPLDIQGKKRRRIQVMCQPQDT
eukprot:14175301-Ditylum_brightwellii.AAC.1